MFLVSELGEQHPMPCFSARFGANGLRSLFGLYHITAIENVGPYLLYVPFNILLLPIPYACTHWHATMGQDKRGLGR